MSQCYLTLVADGRGDASERPSPILPVPAAQVEAAWSSTAHSSARGVVSKFGVMSTRLSRVDDAIRRAIAEYLSYHELHETLHAFSSESQRVRAAGATRRQPLTATRMARLRQDFVRCFDAGQKDEFFRLWTAYVPWDVQQCEPFAQRLEFYLHIHFAVTPFRRAGPAAPVPPEAEVYLREFRQYLEGPGQHLAQTSEFLAYYALPFVPDPRRHPSFRAVFSTEWVDDLRNRALHFFQRMLQRSASLEQEEPTLYRRWRASEDTLSSPPDGIDPATVRLREQKAFVSGERKVLPPAQAVVTAGTDALAHLDEALASVERSLPSRKKAVPPWYQPLRAAASTLRERVGASRTEVDQVLRDVAKQTAIIRRAVATQAGRDNHPRLRRKGHGLHDGEPEGEAGAEEERKQGRLDAGQASAEDEDEGEAVPPALSLYRGSLSPLDFPRIRRVLARLQLRAEQDEVDERRASLVLQALRWRLTRSQPGAPRRRVLYELVAGDVVGVTPAATRMTNHSDGTTIVMAPLAVRLLRCGAPAVREGIARFVNALSSRARGRSYLLRAQGLLDALIDGMRREEGDTGIRQHALGAVQKFSLRRAPQSRMIERGVVEWVVDLLDAHAHCIRRGLHPQQQQEQQRGGGGHNVAEASWLSEYSLEYASALLMNLSLRPEGKARAAAIAIPSQDAGERNVLHVMTDVLSLESDAVRTYIHGTLYSLLVHPGLRRRARASGIREFLEQMLQVSEEPFHRQLTCIIGQLEAPLPEEGGPPETEQLWSGEEAREKKGETAEEEEEEEKEEERKEEEEADEEEGAMEPDEEGDAEEAVWADPSEGEQEGEELLRHFVVRDDDAPTDTDMGADADAEVDELPSASRHPALPRQQHHPSPASLGSQEAPPVASAAAAPPLPEPMQPRHKIPRTPPGIERGRMLPSITEKSGAERSGTQSLSLSRTFRGSGETGAPTQGRSWMDRNGGIKGDDFVDDRDDAWQFENPQTPSRQPSRPTGSAGLTPMTETSYQTFDDGDGGPMTPMEATLEGASPRTTPDAHRQPDFGHDEAEECIGDQGTRPHAPTSPLREETQPPAMGPAGGHEGSPARTAPAPPSPEKEGGASVRFGSLPLPSGVAPEDPHSVFASRSRLVRTPVRSKRGVRVTGARPPLDPEETEEAWMRYGDDE